MGAQWRGVNHNIYSQSTWTGGDPDPYPGPNNNYVASDHRTIDYFHGKGVNHLRMMFTWEWLQPDLHGGIPGSGASSLYWSAFCETVAYATGLGIQVNIAHYGWSPNFWSHGGGNTTPSWKGVGNHSGHEYTNRIGESWVDAATFARLWSALATEFAGNDRVSLGLVNEPHDMDTRTWFATVQSVVDAVRAAGSTAWIHVPGNAYAAFDVDATYSDTATSPRSNGEGWDHANGTGSPLSDPLGKLIAECHIYLDDQGGTTVDILGFRGGSTTDAARDRLAVIVDWARPRGLLVHVGEIGFWQQSHGAPDTWASFVQYCSENSDVVAGFDWWGASEPDWWTDTGAARFSVSPTSHDTYTGDTENMTMIQDAFTG